MNHRPPSLERRAIVQGEHLPLHLGSMLGLVKIIREKFPLTGFTLGTSSSRMTLIGAGDHLPDVAMEAILDATERQIRAGIRQIPDGSYQFEDDLDDDGFGNQRFRVRKITVEADEITLDFTGSARQVKGNIDISCSGLEATGAYTLKCLIDPNVPSNEGFYRPIKIVASEGLIVNSAFLAASAGRAQACQRVVDVIIGALAPALPERAVAAANGLTESEKAFRIHNSYLSILRYVIKEKNGYGIQSACVSWPLFLDNTGTTLPTGWPWR